MGATENVVIKYRHCVYKGGKKSVDLCEPEDQRLLYDPDKINDNARPPKDGKMVYFRSGVKFKGQSGISYFIHKFNTTGFGSLWSKL